MISGKVLLATQFLLLIAHLAPVHSEAEPGFTKVVARRRFQDGQVDRNGRSLANTFPFAEVGNQYHGGQLQRQQLFSATNDQTPVFLDNPLRARGASLGHQSQFFQTSPLQFGQRQFLDQPQQSFASQSQFIDTSAQFQQRAQLTQGHVAAAQTAQRFATGAAVVSRGETGLHSVGQVGHTVTSAPAVAVSHVTAAPADNLAAHLDHLAAADHSAHLNHAGHGHADALAAHQAALAAHEARVQAHIAAMNGGRHDLIATSHLSHGVQGVAAPAFAPAPAAHVLSGTPAPAFASGSAVAHSAHVVGGTSAPGFAAVQAVDHVAHAAHAPIAPAVDHFAHVAHAPVAPVAPAVDHFAHVAHAPVAPAVDHIAHVAHATAAPAFAPAPIDFRQGVAVGPAPVPVEVDINHVAIAGEQCVEKIVTVEETEADEQLDCKHSYDKKCTTTYVTDYEPQQEEECEENFKKNCFIEYKKVAHDVTVEFCHTPLVKDCNIEGPVECRTEYEAECATRYHEHQVVDDVPDCTTFKEVKCKPVQKGYKTEQDCTEWPVQRCSVRSELVKKVSPETSCEKIPKRMCAPRGCGFVPGLPECFDKTETVVQEVPEETCELNPQRSCKHVTKLVPNLKPVEECIDVPKEVCHRSKTNPRKVAKPVVKKWCYTPTKESGLFK